MTKLDQLELLLTVLCALGSYKFGWFVGMSLNTFQHWNSKAMLNHKDLREKDADYCRRRAQRIRTRASTIEGVSHVDDLKRRYYLALADEQDINARLHLAKGPGLRDGDKTFSQLLEERAAVQGRCSAIVILLGEQGVSVKKLYGSLER